jgi:large subunit ribosomal protein L23
MHDQIIIKPLITEKSTRQQQSRNAYAFEVLQGANKVEIKRAVEKLYSVKVVNVRTMTRKGKPRRTKTKVIHTTPFKRAIVTLDENSKIELF